MEDVEIGFPKENRVPDMNDAVDCFVYVLEDEGNEQHNGVPSHDIKIVIVDRDLEGLRVAHGELGEGLDHVSKVVGS